MCKFSFLDRANENKARIVLTNLCCDCREVTRQYWRVGFPYGYIPGGILWNGFPIFRWVPCGRFS